GKFAERQNNDIGRTQHRQRGDRSGKHADLASEVLGDARRDRIEHRAGVDAALSRQDGAESFASLGPVHAVSLSWKGKGTSILSGARGIAMDFCSRASRWTAAPRSSTIGLH